MPMLARTISNTDSPQANGSKENQMPSVVRTTDSHGNYVYFNCNFNTGAVTRVKNPESATIYKDHAIAEHTANSVREVSPDVIAITLEKAIESYQAARDRERNRYATVPDLGTPDAQAEDRTASLGRSVMTFWKKIFGSQ
jgi:hypothetical protein